MKKFGSFLIVCFVIFAFLGCSREPIVAFFKDGTSAGSDNYTINVSFVEDTKFEEKFIDILIKSNIDNLVMSFKREFDEDIQITISEKDEWNSLTYLINQANDEENQESYLAFSEKRNMTLVIKSEQDAIITLKAVCGDEFENSLGEVILVNQVDISKLFSQDLGKNHE